MPSSSPPHVLLTSTALPTPHSAVVYRALPDGGVLFSTTDEVYFGLNETGAFVWEHLAPACPTIDALCEAVCARFPDAGADAVRQDVTELLAAFVENGLAVAS